MTRRQARELALQALFQLDFNPAGDASLEEAVQAAIDAAAAEQEQKLSEKNQAFVSGLVQGTLEHEAEIDELLSACSKDWRLDRMAGVDRNIARMAVYELKLQPERLEAGIAINEAVELAKKYGTDDSARFINGLLAGIVNN